MNIAIPILAAYIYRSINEGIIIGILHPNHKNIKDSNGEIYPFNYIEEEWNEDEIIRIRTNIRINLSKYGSYEIKEDISKLQPIYINKIKEEKYLKSHNS